MDAPIKRPNNWLCYNANFVAFKFEKMHNEFVQ